MIFLYRFDVIGADAITTDSSTWPGLSNIGTPLYDVYLLTNYERPIPYVSTGGAASLIAAGVPPTSASFTSAAGWVPTPGIESNGIELNAEKSAGNISLKLPMTHAVAQLYKDDFPNARVWLTVGTLSAPDGVPLIVWTGEVQSVEFDEQRATFQCAHLRQLLERPALTAKYGRTCQSPLFDAAGCGLKRNRARFQLADGTGADSLGFPTPAGALLYYEYREDALLQATSYDAASLTLTVPEASNRANGYFSRGYVVIGAQYDSLNRFCRRVDAVTYTDGLGGAYGPYGGSKCSIVSHVGNQLVLATPLIRPLTAGTKVSIYAGCDKLPSTCKSAKFNNYQSFKGYLISVKNPYTSGLKP